MPEIALTHLKKEMVVEKEEVTEADMKEEEEGEEEITKEMDLEDLDKPVATIVMKRVI